MAAPLLKLEISTMSWASSWLIFPRKTPVWHEVQDVGTETSAVSISVLRPPGVAAAASAEKHQVQTEFPRKDLSEFIKHWGVGGIGTAGKPAS